MDFSVFSAFHINDIALIENNDGNDNDSSSNLNRQQKDKNQLKKHKSKHKTTESGEAQLCGLCKAAGVGNCEQNQVISNTTSTCKKNVGFSRKVQISE